MTRLKMLEPRDEAALANPKYSQLTCCTGSTVVGGSGNEGVIVFDREAKNLTRSKRKLNAACGA
jgi:hypothetical protein